MAAKAVDPGAAVIKAAKRGDAAWLAGLLDADAGLIGARDADGSTPLHFACWNGHVECVRLLLERGADVAAVNANEHYGTTPLHAAAHANQRVIAIMLLERGADPNARDMHGRTPLAHTEFHKATAAAKVLREHGGQ